MWEVSGLEEAPKRLHPPLGFRMSDPFDDDEALSGWLVSIKIEVAGAATARAALDTRHAEDLTGPKLVWRCGLVARVLCLSPAQRLISSVDGGRCPVNGGFLCSG